MQAILDFTTNPVVIALIIGVMIGVYLTMKYLDVRHSSRYMSGD